MNRILIKDLGVGHGRFGRIVTITFNSTADKHTKNTIKNHGPEFMLIEDWPNEKDCNWTTDKVLVRCGKKGWAGWLNPTFISVK